MKAVQQPVYMALDLSGLPAIGHTYGYQLNFSQAAEWLSISPGLCILGAIGATPPAALNGGLGLRLYNEIVVLTDGKFHPDATPQGKPAFTQIMDGPRLIPWERSLTVYIEITTIQPGNFPAGSSLELIIQPFTG